MSKPLVVAIITPDLRDEQRRYSEPQPVFGYAPGALLQGFENNPECEVHIVSCVQRPVASPEKVAENIFYHSVQIGKWGWMRGAYAGCIFAVRKKLREIRPDIVHGQGTERYGAISAAFSGYPNVITIHGNMNALAKLYPPRFGSYHWLAARLENFTLPRTNGIICISDYVKNLVQNYGVPIWLVPNAIQRMFFDFPKEDFSARKKPLLINVGVIGERKRQQELLTVLESLRSEGLDFDALFVGVSSPQSAYAVKFNALLERANHQHGGFEHLQKLDDASFCRLFDRASAMIHFSSEESFGLTFAEAIARGLYLFASDVGAIRDIAKGVARVQIFDLDKWDEMKNAVRQWLVSKANEQPRPQNPPAEFIERYHPVLVARRHLEIYREVINLRSTGRLDSSIINRVA